MIAGVHTTSMKLSGNDSARHTSVTEFLTTFSIIIIMEQAFLD